MGCWKRGGDGARGVKNADDAGDAGDAGDDADREGLDSLGHGNKNMDAGVGSSRENQETLLRERFSVRARKFEAWTKKDD